MKTFSEFVAHSNIPEKLVRATIKQIGGWRQFKNLAPVICKNDERNSFKGFTYHTQTIKFFSSHRDLIRIFLNEIAKKNNQSIFHMTRLDETFSLNEIRNTLYGPKPEIDTRIAHICACFILNYVARTFINVSKK